MPNTLVLRALTGDLRGQEFAVPDSSHYIMGRSRSCSLRLTGDATVSRQHCLIEVDPRGVWVQDLGSLNGTLINGTNISRNNVSRDGATCVQSPRQELHDGDELRVCNNVFAVCLRETAPAPKSKDTMRWVPSSPEVQHAFA
jgi:pSer/pThr/pTyr-binding forkhead associated (FHA) protein